MKQLVKKFSGRRILVYGDFVLDEFLYGRIDRISREAPVFIVSHESSDFRPGCAANAVANLAALGAAVLPCGIVGDDDYGIILRRILNEMKVSTVNLIPVDNTKTALKTRVIAGGMHSVKQQIVRIDRLNDVADGPEVDNLVKERLKSLLGQTDAVLISDYGIGGLELGVAQWLLQEGRNSGKPVLVDSRYRLMEYTGATAATPNQPEAEECTNAVINSLSSLHESGTRMLEKLESEALVITRGPDGMSLFRPDSEPVDIPAYGDEEVVDVTGAGDTVIAAFTLAIAAGADFVEAARTANVAGGLSVLKKGTAAVSREDMIAALTLNPA
jgi:D-glycero-beta-D-manno-heptose-7-phosphate kinase